MMTIKTSKGTEHKALWIDGPTSIDGSVVMRFKDDRPLHIIAEEFTGVERIERISENQGNKTYEGYINLMLIKRRDGIVQIHLTKEA